MNMEDNNNTYDVCAFNNNNAHNMCVIINDNAYIICVINQIYITSSRHPP